jgi:hypothetical protein
MSAQQIPAVAYTCAAASLAVRANRAAAPTEVAVLAATALLALIDFGPTSAKQLESARLAFRAAQDRPAPARERVWLFAIALKVLGQLSGLAWMAASATGSGVLRGGALMMAGNICFWLASAGAARHDAKGEHAPVPPNLVRVILTADSVLFLALMAGAVAPVGSVRRSVGSCLFVVGAMAGVVENVRGFVKGMPGTLVGVVPQSEG